MVPLWSLPPAVITGNCIILKPSERDPGACMILAELAREAGFPPGVINIVHGGAPTVDFMLDEPAIKAIAFVGANKAGEYIYRRGAEQGKRVQANLGAKNHAAILPDANKNFAINSVVGAAFGAAGQRCMALSTIVTVGESQQWLTEIADKARGLKVNGGFEEGTDVGPVISPQARERIESVIASAEEEGATILLDGRGYRPADYPNGNFVSPPPPPTKSTFQANNPKIGPTIITNVQPHMRCYKEEIFGPVLVCLHTPTLDEAITLINNNEYGNGAAIFTRSGAAAQHFQKNIEAGQVGLNVPIPVPIPAFSFTGNKKRVAGGGMSTFYGKPGLAFYTQTKTVTSLWREEDSGLAERAAAIMPTMS